MERALQKVLLPAIFITSKKKKLKLPCSWCCHHCERAPPHMRCACGMRWLLFIQHCHRLSTLIGVLLSLSPPAPSTDQPTDMADGKRWWTGRRNRRLAISASPNKEKDNNKKKRNDDGFWHVNRAAQIKWIGRRTPKTESESILEEKKNQLNAFELCCCLGFLLLLLLIWAGADIYVTPLMVVDQFRAVFFFWIDVMKLKRSFVILYDIYISRRGNWGWWDWIIIRRPKRLSLFTLWRTLEFDWN